MRNSQRFIRLCALALLVLFCAPSAPAEEAERPDTQPATRPAPEAETKPAVTTVTIFNTADIHEHTRNLARIAAHVKAARQADPNVLLIDAGDMVGGYGEREMNITNGQAMFDLMSAMGYDIGILGNWEYTLGKDRIIELCRKYPDFPILMSNVKWGEDEEDLAKLMPPYKIFELKGLKVAVVGTGSHDMRYARRRRFEIYYQPAVIHQLVPALRKHADIVIAVTHQYEKHDYKTASGPDAPDLILGGHSHGAYARQYGREGKCYIIKPGPYARKLGKVVIKWDGSKIVSCEGSLLDVPKDWPEDEKVKSLRDKYIQDARSKQKKPPAKKPKKAPQDPAAGAASGAKTEQQVGESK